MCGESIRTETSDLTELRDLQLGRKCQSIDPLDIASGLALEKMTGIYFYL